MQILACNGNYCLSWPCCWPWKKVLGLGLENKMLRRGLGLEKLSCPWPWEKKSWPWPCSCKLEVHFGRTFLLGGESWRVSVVNLAVLTCELRPMNISKKVVNFSGETSAPQRKSWLRL